MVGKVPYAALAKRRFGEEVCACEVFDQAARGLSYPALPCWAMSASSPRTCWQTAWASIPSSCATCSGCSNPPVSCTSSRALGGATLAKAPADITLLDVFRAVEDEGELFRFHEHPNIQCPVGRNVHAVLGGKLDEADQAMEARLASVTLQDIADETRERMKAQDAEDAHGSRE